MLRTSLCDYSDAYILISETITIAGERDDATAEQEDERNKGVIFKNSVPIIDCKKEINNARIDEAKYIDVVMPMYNLIEYSSNY